MYSVLFIGYSVTEEREGYVSAVQALCSEQHTPLFISKKAIGGANTAALPYLLNSLLTERYDYVVFEIATCLRWAADVNIYISVLEDILSICKSKATYPLFVNLYRQGVDYSADIMGDTIKCFCERRGLPFLDLTNALLTIEKNGQLSEYLRDGIHTTSIGAAFYAGHIYNFLLKSLENNPGWKKQELLFASDILGIAASGRFERGGVDYPFVSLEENTSLIFNFPESIEILWVMFVSGPLSGEVRFESPEAGFRYQLSMYDQHSYYRRYSYWTLKGVTTSRLLASALSGIPAIQLNKGTADTSPRMNDIVGFLVNM